MHLAALVRATGGWADFERTNVAGTARLVDAARRAGAGSFVHVSSPSVAHAGRSLVGAGADAANPATARGSYARSKAMGEILALDASSAAMPVVAIRPHLIWGPGDTQLVGRVVDRARRGRLALVGSGTALVDTIYVDNAADALVAAVDRAPQLGGRAFVISNGEPRTATELMARVLAAAGLTVTTRHVPTWAAKAGGSIVEQIWARTGRTDDPPMTRFLAEQLATAHWFRQAESRAALHLGARGEPGRGLRPAGRLVPNPTGRPEPTCADRLPRADAYSRSVNEACRVNHQNRRRRPAPSRPSWRGLLVEGGGVNEACRVNHQHRRRRPAREGRAGEAFSGRAAA